MDVGFQRSSRARLDLAGGALNDHPRPCTLSRDRGRQSTPPIDSRHGVPNDHTARYVPLLTVSLVSGPELTRLFPPSPHLLPWSVRAVTIVDVSIARLADL